MSERSDRIAELKAAMAGISSADIEEAFHSSLREAIDQEILQELREPRLSLPEPVKGPIDDLIGFNTYRHEGRNWYGCRGMGPTYQGFYQWLNHRTIVDSRDDFPWHYFVLTEADEKDFLMLYGNVYGIYKVD